MKAIIQESYGSPKEVLHLREVDVPVVGDDEVLVRVHSASVHADIWHVITGRPYMARLMMAALRKPKHPIPGTDMAGVVEQVGKDVTRFQVGDEVFGESHSGLQWHNGGAYAEYVAAPENALALKPSNVTFEQAASIPTSGYIALINMDGAKKEREDGPTKRVLVNGAGGGVGNIAVQIAKAYGAHVTAVDNTQKLAMLGELGADAVIDYTQENVTEGDQVYDFILDVASNLVLADCKRILSEHGTYMMIGHDHYGDVGNRTFGNLPRFFGVLARTPFNKHLPSLDFEIPGKQEVMEALREFLEEGQLTPMIDRTYPLSEVPEAIAYMQTGENIGKILISIE